MAKIDLKVGGRFRIQAKRPERLVFGVHTLVKIGDQPVVTEGCQGGKLVSTLARLRGWLRSFYQSRCVNCNDIQAGKQASHRTFFPALKAYREYANGQITIEEYRCADTREVVTCTHCGKEHSR